MPVVLALDQGTTSSRATVFDHDGRLRSMPSGRAAELYAGWQDALRSTLT